MTFVMEYIGPNYNGGYKLKLTDSSNTQINLDVHGWSFGKTLMDIFKDFPNDFRDEVYHYMVDCATKYFSDHPDAKGYIRFFELLEEISEHDYEEED